MSRTDKTAPAEVKVRWAREGRERNPNIRIREQHRHHDYMGRDLECDMGHVCNRTPNWWCRGNCHYIPDNNYTGDYWYARPRRGADLRKKYHRAQRRAANMRLAAGEGPEPLRTRHSVLWDLW